MIASPSNRLLHSLSRESRERILTASTSLCLPTRTALIEPGKALKYAYFLTSGICSVVIELSEGGSAEVSLVGREGLVGALDLLGPAPTPAHCFIQVEATAHRILFTDLRKIFHESEEVRTRILEAVQQQSLTMAQVAACNKLHQVEARLARWLLMAHDRTQEETLPLTQEFLAQMLGTQRSTVAMVAGALQRSGFIAYNRGKVIIQSREDLENAACECYPITKTLFDKLYS